MRARSALAVVPLLALSPTTDDCGFEGKIDEVAIYDKALDLARISAHFAAAN